MSGIFLVSSYPSSSIDIPVVLESDKLLPNSGSSNWLFGYDVDIYENTIVIGSPGYSSNRGIVYIFTFDGTSWTEIKVYVGPQSGANAGTSVAIHGNTMVFGAPNADRTSPTALTDQGDAYIVRYDGTNWGTAQLVRASNAASATYFGAAVATYNDVVVVGAWNARVNTSVSGYGLAYVFNFNGTSWVETQILDPSFNNATLDFGYSVAIHNDLIVVGARGGNYLFIYEYIGTSWVETQFIQGAGEIVALNKGPTVQNDFIVASDVDTDIVNIYTNNGFEWELFQTIDFSSIFDSGSIWQIEGISLYENILVIGVYSSTPTSNIGAYVFKYNGSTWEILQKFIGTNMSLSTYEFARSLSVFNNKVVAGTTKDGVNGGNSGSAFVFDIIE